MMIVRAGGGGAGGGGGAMGGASAAMAAQGGEGGAVISGSREGGGGREGRRGMFFGGPGGGGAGGEGGGRGPMAGLSDEDRTKMREAMQKALNGRQMQDLTPEERQNLFAEVSKSVPALAKLREQARQQGGSGGAAAGAGQGAGREGRRGEGGGQGRPGGDASGGPGAPGGFAGSGGPPAMMAFGGGSQYSQKDLDNAKLPPPVDPDNQLEVLLRPGLLADVEIILEKFPSAINIPNQAVFEKDGKPIVFVKKGNSWEERQVQPLKRSETIMVVASGLKPGEEIAMSDPHERPGDKKKKSDKPAGGSSPVGNLPGGGGRS
jgi:hypothetical protein